MQAESSVAFGFRVQQIGLREPRLTVEFNTANIDATLRNLKRTLGSAPTA